jgi:hypothetical protein
MRSLSRLFVLAVPLALVVAACGTTSSTPTAAPTVVVTAPPVATSAPVATEAPSVTAVPSAAPSTVGFPALWNGTWQDTSPDTTTAGKFVVTFTQNGAQLSGSITVTGAACLAKGTVTGTLTGSSISFGAVSGAVTITYSGTISGNTMQGTYDAPSCGGAKGNWSATTAG